MLGFSVVQYLAIRRVTHPSFDSNASRVGVFIVLAWTFSLLGGIAPFTVMLIFARYQPCGPNLRRLVKLVFLYGVDVCVAFVIIVYVTIFILCSLIYLRIRAINRQLVRYDHVANVHCERRAFGTIAMMLVTLGLFFAPYMTLHVLSLNLPAASDYLHDSAVVYYMNLLPYFKFTSDPIIYGLRMREVKVGFLSLSKLCYKGCVISTHEFMAEVELAIIVRAVIVQRSHRGHLEVKVGFLIVVRGCCAIGRSIGDCVCGSRDKEDFYEMTSLPTNHSDRRRLQSYVP